MQKVCLHAINTYYNADYTNTAMTRAFQNQTNLNSIIINDFE